MKQSETGSTLSVNLTGRGSHNRNVIIVGSYNSVSLASQPGLHLSKLQRLSGVGLTGAQQLTAFERKTKFIGRSSELDVLKDWLNAPRLVSVRTIIGPPGIGKTRLAVELADLAESQDWASGFLRASELQRFVNATGLSEWVWDRPILIVVDYAAQKADALGILLEHLQDVAAQTEQELGAQKLRLLLLERDASPQSGWWTRAFGPSGQSDRRIELAEPQAPCPIAALSDEATLALITDTIGRSDRDLKFSSAAVLNACLQTDESRQILGNPLFVQIATLSSIQKETTDLTFSTDVLLGGIVDRERQLMRGKWRKAEIPEVLFKDLERLAAMITLIQGATIQHVRELIGSLPSFSSVTGILSPERIIQALSDALPFDDVYGYRALEPDIIGDRFIVECDLDAELIQSAFRVDRFSLGPRLWRLLEEYQEDQRLGQRISDWVRRLIQQMESVLALDVFVSDAPSAMSGSAAQLYAEARSKITEGLRDGKSTQASLLLGENQKGDLVARSLIGEGFALAKGGNHGEAIKRYDAAIADLIRNNFDQMNILWMWIYSYRAESFDALGLQEERFAAIDQAIAVCHQLIEDGEFEEHAHVDQVLKKLLDNIESTSKIITG
ncbi:tetratricopeptide (TPR) repeat protein [Nitrobacteraceae bacterium AZCC 1564]